MSSTVGMDSGRTVQGHSGDGILETGPTSSPRYTPPTYTLTDTGGCSAEQIIEQLGLGAGHTKFGLSQDALEYWMTSIGN